MFVVVTRTIASVGSWIVGSGTSSTRTSRLPCQVTAFIRVLLRSGRGARGSRSGLTAAYPTRASGTGAVGRRSAAPSERARTPGGRTGEPRPHLVVDRRRRERAEALVRDLFPGSEQPQLADAGAALVHELG